MTGVFLVYIVQHLWGYGPAIAGGIGAILAVAWSGGAVTIANFEGRGRRLAFVVIGSSVLVAGLLVSLTAVARYLLPMIMLGQLIIGLGMGIAWGSLCQVVMETHPEGNATRPRRCFQPCSRPGTRRVRRFSASLPTWRVLQPTDRRKAFALQ